MATGQVFDHPARTHLERAATGAVGVGDVGRAADDLPATGVVRSRQVLEQLFVAELGRLDQRHTRVGHFAQVVAGDFGGHAHRDAAGAVEQSKGQTGGQLLGLFGGAVVVGLEVDRAFVDFVEQEAGDFSQTGLGVAHGRRTIAVARAEVALAVDERVALRKVLCHAHQGFVGCAVAVRVVTAQHVTHHARAFHGLGAGVVVRATEAQAHARHGIQDAALHRFLAVAHVGQGAAFDHTQRVLEVGALGVATKALVVVGC